MNPTPRPRLLVAVAALVALVALAAVPGAQAKSSGRHHARSADRNHDRIPDRWERRFHLKLTRNQAKLDQDHDGLRNRAEYLARTDPRDADTDNDGHEDGAEDAGQVVSFDGTTLVVKSFGGATVTGTVTAATELRCHSAGDLESEAAAGDSAARTASDDGAGDDHGDRSVPAAATRAATSRARAHRTTRPVTTPATGRATSPATTRARTGRATAGPAATPAPPARSWRGRPSTRRSSW